MSAAKTSNPNPTIAGLREMLDTSSKACECMPDVKTWDCPKNVANAHLERNCKTILPLLLDEIEKLREVFKACELVICYSKYSNDLEWVRSNVKPMISKALAQSLERLK